MKTLLLIKSIPILLLGVFGSAFDQNDLSIAKINYEKQLQQEPVYTTTTMLLDAVGPGCNTMQINVYATYPNGQVFLKHTAIIQSGYGCTLNYVVCSDTFSVKSGPEYIIRDEMLNGSIRNFFTSRQDVYRAFVAQKERLLGIQ